uniref:INCENP_ARK-bind domain-containing protein n=1 Tax=Schistosoma mansoni TaxID=6183 RepID=A0A3Q0KHK7_SCHMA
MELYQQFLLTEDILKNIINDAKQNIQATFKEITAALGGIETSVDDGVLSEDLEKQIEKTEDLLLKPVVGQKRKVKTSIHSARCEHSPLNRSKLNQVVDSHKSPAKLLKNSRKLSKQLRSAKDSPKQTEPQNIFQPSGNMCDLKSHKPQLLDSSILQTTFCPTDKECLISTNISNSEPQSKRTSNIEERKCDQINESELNISRTGDIQMSAQKLSEKKRKLSMDTSDYQPLVKRTSFNKIGLTTESKHNVEDEAPPKDEQLLNLTMPLGHAPATTASSSTNTTKSPSLESATSLSDSSSAPPQSNVNSINNTFVTKSPFGDLSNIQKLPCPSIFSTETQTKHIPRLPVPATDKRITSLENKTASTCGKSRLFSSTERLGGVSRLNSLNHPIQASKPRTGSKLNSINEKVSVNTSLNGCSNKHKNRSGSVLSDKEQRMEAKRQVFIEQMEKREERLRAFQDAQKQKMEARKKANEERFLAVQQRYQQMLQGNHLQVKESNTSVTSVQPSNVSAKPLQPTTVLKKCHVNLNPMDHNTLKVQNKPVTIIKQTQPNTCPKPQPVSKLNTIQPTKLQTHEKVITTQKVSLISSPVVNESFDISQLNSDSESDDDEPNMKVPGWCRKGNPEMIAAMSDVYSNKLKWQNEFLPASMITFDISDVFRNYQYTIRPRTSSGIWNTPGASKSSTGRSILKKILL